jgi:hypothetical protein
MPGGRTGVLTRRQALQLGAATGVAAMFGGPEALARAATGVGPRHYLRASYLPLAGETFRVGASSMQLHAVEDLAGALTTKSLRGHPQAFALTFYGPPGAVAGMTQTFSHATLGTYSLFVVPVGAVDGAVQRYEVVVDRSVGSRPQAPAERPRPKRETSEPPHGFDPGAAEAKAEAAALREQFAPPAVKRKLAARRRRRARLKKARLRRARVRNGRRGTKRRRPVGWRAARRRA